MRHTVILATIVLMLSIVPIMPAVEAQTYTPMTGEQWSDFLERCAEFMEWVLTTEFTDSPYAGGGTVASHTPIADSAAPAGAYCGIGDDDHQLSPSSSVTPVTPTTNRAKVVDFCAVGATWFSATCFDGATGSRERNCQLFTTIGTGCSAATERVIVFAAEYTAAWTPVTLTAAGNCRWSSSATSQGDVLPITPTWKSTTDGVSTCTSGGNNGYSLTMWNDAALAKRPEGYIRSEEGIGTDRIGTTAFGASGTTSSAVSKTSPTYRITDAWPSGFMYTIAVWKNPPSVSNDVVVTATGGVVAVGPFEGGSYTSGADTFKWSLWRLSYNSHGLNETDTTDFTITYATDDGSSGFLGQIVPAESTGGFSGNRYMQTMAPYVGGTHLTQGIFVSWSYPPFLSPQLTWSIVNDDGDAVENALVTAENRLDFYDTCTTGPFGTCDMENIPTQTLTVTLSKVGFPDNTYNIILGYADPDCTEPCEIELLFSKQGGATSIEETDFQIIFDGLSQFETGSKLTQNVTRTKLNTAYIMLFWLRANPPESVFRFRWADTDRTVNTAIRYPITGNLSTVMTGDYVLYATNESGGYINSKALCVYTQDAAPCTTIDLDAGTLSTLDELASAQISIMNEKNSAVTTANNLANAEDQFASRINWVATNLGLIAAGIVGFIGWNLRNSRKRE